MLSRLRSIVAAYHQKDVSATVVGGTDMFMFALNSAVTKAESLHNFEYQRFQGTLDVDGESGGDLSAVVFSRSTLAPELAGKVKSVAAVSIGGSSGTIIPLNFSNNLVALERVRTTDELSSTWLGRSRYPSDAEVEASYAEMSVIQSGTKLFIFPTGATLPSNPTPLIIDGFQRTILFDESMEEGEDALDPEVFDTHPLFTVGFNYLVWECVLELNPLFQTFVPRQEGNVGFPQAQRDEAWRNLLVWDSYQIDGATTRSR